MIYIITLLLAIATYLVHDKDEKAFFKKNILDEFYWFDFLLILILFALIILFLKWWQILILIAFGKMISYAGKGEDIMYFDAKQVQHENGEYKEYGS